MDRYGRLVAWAIRRELKRFGMAEEEAEDIFQVVWTRLWSGGLLNKLKDPHALSSWLVSVSVHEARAYIRARLRRGAGAQVSLEESGLIETAAANPGGNPDLAAIARELGEILSKELRTLSSRDRMVLKLFFEEGVKVRAIAEFIQAPLNTVLSIINRARHKVSDALRAKGIEPS